jgi:[acyl-carrier-protein] S-malonyltransferase
VKLAIVFPGQASQSVGMMHHYDGLPRIRETFDEASAIFGADLWALVAEGPAEKLHLTAFTQPIMLVAGVAVLRAWEALGGPPPALLAGHSLGEYTALVAAGALRFEDAVLLVRHRAEAMQAAAPQGVGGMAAILGLPDEEVLAVCKEAAQDEVLEAANFNAPSQVVIAGHDRALHRGIDLAKARGAKRGLMLPMSVPCHCSLMRPAALSLTAYLSEIELGAPSVPVIHNADVASHSTPTAIKDALARQLYSPVRWVDTVRHLLGQGVTHLVECGPGRVLAGITKRTAGDLPQYTLADTTHVHETLAALSLAMQGEKPC